MCFDLGTGIRLSVNGKPLQPYPTFFTQYELQDEEDEGDGTRA
jgi:hypothetical protein